MAKLQGTNQLNEILLEHLGDAPMNPAEKVELNNLVQNLALSEELFERSKAVLSALRMFVIANREFFATVRGSRSQATMAQRADVHQPYVSALERGHVETISDAALLKLIRAYVEISQEGDPVAERRQALLELLKGDATCTSQ